MVLRLLLPGRRRPFRHDILLVVLLNYRVVRLVMVVLAIDRALLLIRRI